MKFSHMVKAAAMAAVALLGAGQAQAVILQHEGTFTVSAGHGVFSGLTGEVGSFTYIIDYDAPDPLPGAFEGDIPNAVIGMGFSLAGESFFEFLNAPLNIDIVSESGEVQLFADMGTVSSTNFGDFDVGFIPKVDASQFFSNPLSSGTGDFGISFGFLFHTMSPSFGFLGVKGSDGVFFGEGSVTSNSQFEPPQVGDPVTNPPDPPQVGDPVTNPPVTTVPVPAALPLMLAAIGGLFLARFRRRAAGTAAA